MEVAKKIYDARQATSVLQKDLQRTKQPLPDGRENIINLVKFLDTFKHGHLESNIGQLNVDQQKLYSLVDQFGTFGK